MMTYDPDKHHRRSIRLRGYDYSGVGAYFVTICVNRGECLLGEVADDQMHRNEIGRTAHEFWAQIPVHFPNSSIDEFAVMPNHVHAIIMIHDPADAAGGSYHPCADGKMGGETPLPPPFRRGEVTAPIVPNTADVDAREPDGETPPLHFDQTGGGGEMGGETPPLHFDQTCGGGEMGGETPPLHFDQTCGGEPDGETPPLHFDQTCGGGEMGGETPPLPADPSRIEQPTLGQIVAYYKYQTTKEINQQRRTPGVRFWQRNYWEHIIRDRELLNQIREYIQNNPASWADDQLRPDAPPNPFNRWAQR